MKPPHEKEPSQDVLLALAESQETSRRLQRAATDAISEAKIWKRRYENAVDAAPDGGWVTRAHDAERELIKLRETLREACGHMFMAAEVGQSEGVLDEDEFEQEIAYIDDLRMRC